MNRSASIIPGEDRFETHDSVVSAGLDAAQEGRVGVALGQFIESDTCSNTAS
ncbi:siderochrome-iron transporter [Aspergillus luchuensis]|uniref:Siderochrome-iron transporter n=1 Tax=Aspergillus kawachii TaxID=1069201 RepID=A0A146FZR4_ASPKA|nr:siderochrome-iron transporter [Aspergillus luchuensis]